MIISTQALIVVIAIAAIVLLIALGAMLMKKSVILLVKGRANRPARAAHHGWTPFR